MTISTDIRKLLRSEQYEDGMTVSEIAAALHRKPELIGANLSDMPDAQIDRWMKSGHQWVAVWTSIVPVHCPRPETKRKATA